jgi:uncharacterized protein YndB with AHSA1/START domain
VPASATVQFEHSVSIAASPSRVMAAFFDPQGLATWWHVARSVTTPRSPGVFAVEWEPTAERDELLGPLGGVFHGTVIDYLPGHKLFVGDAWWVPPEGEPIGPMALEVVCERDGAVCRLRVRQSGIGDNPRSRRYYDVIGRGWRSSMAALKAYVEGETP